MRIVADSAIPFVERFFSQLGELHLLTSGDINNNTIRDADLLICRTVNRIDATLLDKTNVTTIASPTSGTDHVDSDYLLSRGINFFHAPGCNARSVAEYVLSAVCVLAEQQGLRLEEKSIGIIGYGHVGSKVDDFFSTLGLTCKIYDPFLDSQHIDRNFVSLEEIITCDIISLHVPLTDTGDYPTLDMIDSEFLSGLKEEVILINTSRGSIINEKALKDCLLSSPKVRTVLDVWEGEPQLDADLFMRADIATPHIAGYAIDAKHRGCRNVFRQVCINLQKEFDESVDSRVFEDEEQKMLSVEHIDNDTDALQLAVLASYDVRTDAAALRRMLDDDVSDRAAYFSDLRNHYPIRREFSSTSVSVSNNRSSLREKLLSLGFTLDN